MDVFRCMTGNQSSYVLSTCYEQGVASSPHQAGVSPHSTSARQLLWRGHQGAGNRTRGRCLLHKRWSMEQHTESSAFATNGSTAQMRKLRTRAVPPPPSSLSWNRAEDEN